MKKSGFINFITLFFILSIFSISFSHCKKTEDPIKYLQGSFPDTVLNLNNINSVWDDYNVAPLQIADNFPIVFSSNRKSAGGQFDLEQGMVSYVFDQKTGAFEVGAAITTDTFLDKLINKAKTAGNDFGPYRLFSSVDGFDYLVLSSVNQAGNLDLYYLKNEPVIGITIPEVTNPLPVKLMNTSSDDVYFTLNYYQDTAYYSSDKDGNFDIFFLKKPAGKDLASWFNLDYVLPARTDSINSSADDKCPFILKRVMVFASNRPGGIGGYDLYYSILKSGKWTSPVNFGPRINTSSDEYRPIIGFNPGFTNSLMMFSSNRAGGKGGFDLYFTGVDFRSK